MNYIFLGSANLEKDYSVGCPVNGEMVAATDSNCGGFYGGS